MAKVQDLVVPVATPYLLCGANILVPGLGTCIQACVNDQGFNPKVLGLGFLIHFIFFVGFAQTGLLAAGRGLIGWGLYRSSPKSCQPSVGEIVPTVSPRTLTMSRVSKSSTSFEPRSRAPKRSRTLAMAISAARPAPSSILIAMPISRPGRMAP